MLRGSPHALGERVEPGVPVIAARSEPALPASRSHGESSGRRLALAKWIADPGNALALRTVANRLWQHHFGTGLCPTPNDLGKLGEEPVDPAFLDWLAAQLPANGWSLKAMHRLIMQSAAYRMSSVPTASALAKDAPNALLSRFRMRRLGAEELRDAMLASAGTLSAERGGAPVRPPMPAEVLATSSRPEEAWPLTPEGTWTRRTLYVQIKRSLQHPLLSVFDMADMDSPCPVRFATVQPTQSLILFNGDFANEQARRLAERARGSAGSQRERAAAAIRFAYGRSATEAELDAADRFGAKLAGEGVTDPDRALDLFALMLVNSNEFLHVD
jgi:hypothetical protein